MISVIFFDQGGVLVKEAGNDQIRLLSEYSGKSVDHCKDVRKKYWRKLKFGLINDDEYWYGSQKYPDLAEGMFKELNILSKDQDIVRKKSVDVISLLDYSPELLKRLSKQYKLGIISNNSHEWGEDVLKRFGLNKFFEILVFSHIVGLAKPDEKIFEYAISDLLDVSPENILFIDDKEKSLLPAKALGWNTILFTSSEKLKQELGKLGILV